ncbi:MAG: hypothetical protein A2Y38_02175 [Spirochaetes bacterium GWB1_59_5]|nr:MAG: hypothetical protein A2Y38_02175 [Spirochaetes bacterium GWB1_59_5]
MHTEKDRTHRDLPPIPTDPVIRRAAIKWLLDHKLWTHPDTLRMPPAGATWSDDLETALADSEAWPEEPCDEGSWHECIEINVVYVNPATELIDDDDNLNTAFRTWIEAGGWCDVSLEGESFPTPEGGWNNDNRWMRSHDYRLDTGSTDLETALLELARLVRFFYGDGREGRAGAPVACEGHFKDDRYIHGHQDAGDGFCTVCGFNIREE